VAFNLGDIIVTIKAKTDDLKNGINEIEKLSDHASKGVGRVGTLANGFEKFAKVAATGMTVATAATAAFGVVSVKAFTESEDVMAQTEAVLKSTGGVAGMTADKVSQLASSLQSVTKFSDETIQSGENMLLTFTNIGQDIFPQATETMLNMSQALGQDVQSSAIQLGKALQDPILGVTALRRVGVNFNDSQQEVIKNLVETGRAGEAQAMILKELQTEFGGSAKAAGETFSGKLTILKNKFGDVQEKIGLVLVKGMTPFLEKLSSIAETAEFQAFVEKATNAMVSFFQIIVQVVKKMVDLASWLNKHRALLAVVAGVVGTLVVAGFVAWAMAATAAAVATLAATWPIIALGALIGALAYIVSTNWEQIRETISTTVASIVSVAQSMWATIVGFWQSIRDIAVSTWQSIFDFISPIINLIGIALNVLLTVFSFVFQTMYAIAVWVWQGIYNTAVKPVLDAIAAAAQWVGGVISGVFNWILSIARPIFSAIGSASQSAWSWIVSVWQGAVGFFSNIWNGVRNAAANAFGGLGSVFGGAWEGMKNGFKSALNWIIDQANKLISGYNSSVGKIPGTPHIANMPRFARGTENFKGGGAVVGEEGPELGLFPSGTKIVPANMTRNLVDNLMGVGSMLKTFMSQGASTFLPQQSAQQSKTSGDRTLNINGPINIGSQQDADYTLDIIQRGLELQPRGIVPA
jgi:phage-related protein